jgi:predicted nucleic acid-binding protein
MIVADANLIAALILPISEHTETAEQILMTDRDWAAPTLWRSECCNILATAHRNSVMNLELAIEAMETAEQVMGGSEFEVSSVETLKLAAASGCTAYDSEYMLLAKELSVRLLTYDKKLLREFPEIAIHPEDFLQQNPA